jgi:tryptophanyl-tRNA synthetase
MGIVLSGVQPTGNLHLGNYLGAINNWVKMQHEHESLFCIVDLHAITVRQNSNELRESVLSVAAAYIACGIDPKKSAIFCQSAVREHTELAWILSCNAPIGWLNRMTQFKEKAGKNREKAALGLYSYPVLMAADILLYKATHVPVGDDQKQHLELARDIAGAFNRNYETELFPSPEPIIIGDTTRIMSLRDGTSKMSKSDPSDNSRINLTDNTDLIAKKFRKAKSDMEEGISYDVEKRPEVSNLIGIYSALSNLSRDEIINKYANAGMAEFKSDLTTIAVEKLSKISSTIKELRENQDYLEEILSAGRDKARAIANTTMQEVRDLVGLR